MSIEGGSLQPIEFPSGSRVQIGRDPSCGIRLDDPSISRRHALIVNQEGRWILTDLGSRHGTRLNSASVQPNVPIPLSHGDRLEVRPFCLRVDLGERSACTLSEGSDSSEAETGDCAGHRRVCEVPQSELQAIAQRRLSTLIDVASSVHTAGTEADMAALALDGCLRATGFGRALMLRSFGDAQPVEVVCARPQSDPTAAFRAVSRTLLRAAAPGCVVRLEDDPDFAQAQSIVSSGVVAALCVPVMMDGVAERFLYLDSSRGGHVEADSAAFCNAVAQLCSLAHSHHRRCEVEQSQKALLDELAKARAAQERIMPATTGTALPYRYSMSSTPGLHVAGDIFGKCDCSHGVTFFLGDVSGKGLGPALMMSGIQAHLDAHFRMGVPITDSLNALGRYMTAHAGSLEFATLLVAQFDPEHRLVRIIDAGHGYAVLVGGDGVPVAVTASGGPPVGAVPDFDYEMSEHSFKLGDRLVLFSDGVAEQAGPDGAMLGFERVIEALRECKSSAQDVDALVRCLAQFAGGVAYSDDVTIASIEWRDPTDTALA